jgi:hypothetical protein
VASTGVYAEVIDGEYSLDDNPYYEQHVAAEIDYLPVRSKAARKAARELVASEFVRSGCDKPRRCPCGGEMWWRATVGAYICGGKPGGRSHMCHWNGEMLSTSLEAIEQEKK